jgi:hypothetical protein
MKDHRKFPQKRTDQLARKDLTSLRVRVRVRIRIRVRVGVGVGVPPPSGID